MLRLLIEWGADEALDEQPHDRLSARQPDQRARTLGALSPVPGSTPRTIEPPARTLSPAPTAAPAILRGGRARQAEAEAAAADSIAALRAAVEGFTGCPLRDTASHTLFAEGDPGSMLLLIGEVPDADEDRAGVAFAGAAGALLDRMLASIGLSRAQMLIAPLIPWRPPGDRKPSPIEMAACLPFLHRLVALSRPRHLVLMGARPTRALLATETPLARLRGRWQPAIIPGMSEPPQALPMRHPASLLAAGSMRREAWHDLLLLRTTLGLASQSSQQRENVSDQSL